MVEKYTRKPNTTCMVCKISIYRRPGEIKKGNVFCSLKCYGISCRKEKPCLICGTLILSSQNKKTCSRACANKLRIGTKYTGLRLKDKVVTAFFLKKRLVKLKGPVCERCSFDNLDILQVHHIDRNRKNNDLSNLELLCPNCHYSEHYYNGGLAERLLRKS